MLYMHLGDLTFLCRALHSLQPLLGFPVYGILTSQVFDQSKHSVMSLDRSVERFHFTASSMLVALGVQSTSMPCHYGEWPTLTSAWEALPDGDLKMFISDLTTPYHRSN